MAKRQEEEAAQAQKEKESGAQPKVLCKTQVQDGDTMFPSAAPASTDQTNVHNVEQTETLIQADTGENDYTDGWWQTFDEDLFAPSCNKQHLTRKEKREQRLKHQQQQKDSQTSQCQSSKTYNRRIRLYNKSGKQLKAVHPQQGFREMTFYTGGGYHQDKRWKE